MKNTILLTIDCLRADHLSCYGYHRLTTPNLDELAENGVIFRQAIANGPNTPPGTQSILTSTYPLMYGGSPFLSKDKITIAEVLSREGCSTAAFHSNAWLSRYYGYERGFDTFYDSIKFGKPDKAVRGARNVLTKTNRIYRLSRKTYNLWKLAKGKFKSKNPRVIDTAEEINKKAIIWIQNQNSNNFFLWLHYMDVHRPFLLPPDEISRYFTGDTKRLEEMQSKQRKDDLSTFINLYDDKIRYVDYSIGQLIDFLESNELFNNTAIIVTADHGQEFYEHGNFGHDPRLYDELLRIPLIIYDPDISRKNITIWDQVEQLDIAPTIVDSLGIKPVKNFLGKSLLPMVGRGKGKHPPVFSETSVGYGSSKLHHKDLKISCRTPEWKLIYYFDGNKKDELFNLRNDPMETKNLYEEEKEVAEEFESRIMGHIKAEEKGRKITEEEKTKQRIRELKKERKI